MKRLPPGRALATVPALLIALTCLTGQDGCPTVDYSDSDGDGYTSDVDCVDFDPAINPGAEEVCNGLDDNCNNLADEDLPFTTIYQDLDGDAYGGEPEGTWCYVPAGSITTGGDCDDSDSGVNPGVAEHCNGVDDDCDGIADNPELVDTYAWYADQDQDGYGDPAAAIESCEFVLGYVPDASDCDDSDAAVNPAAVEICDDLDNDCDGAVDDGASGSLFYADQDGDAYGDVNGAVEACLPPVGYVPLDGDCDDSDAAVNPAAVEICDDLDNDCDGLIDFDDNSVDPGSCGTVCGDGHVDPGELCDDGNPFNGDGCDQFCTPESCGDGVVTAGEECDDANDVSEDGCTDCTIDQGHTCANAINLNTGSDGQGGRLPLGTEDPRWEWSQSPAGPWSPTRVLTECVASWADAPTNAQWVSRSQCATPSGATTYYRALFNIPTEEAAAATTLSGTVWADDIIVGVTLNGMEAPVPEGSGFNGPGAEFGAWPSSLYQAGLNEMIITVQNAVLHAFTPDGLLVSVPDAFDAGSQCEPE